MSYERNVAAMQAIEESLKQEIAARVADPGSVGLIGARVFYLVRQPDGVISGGNIGVFENEEMRDVAMKWIIANIAGLPMDWQTSGIQSRPKKN